MCRDGCLALFVQRWLPGYRAHAKSVPPSRPFSSHLVSLPPPSSPPARTRVPLLLIRLSSLLRSLHVALTMYSTLVSVALFSALAIQGALADFTVETPTITQVRPPLHRDREALPLLHPPFTVRVRPAQVGQHRRKVLQRRHCPRRQPLRRDPVSELRSLCARVSTDRIAALTLATTPSTTSLGRPTSLLASR